MGIILLVQFLDFNARDHPIVSGDELFIPLRNCAQPFHSELLNREKQRPKIPTPYFHIMR